MKINKPESTTALATQQQDRTFDEIFDDFLRRTDDEMREEERRRKELYERIIAGPDHGLLQTRWSQ